MGIEKRVPAKRSPRPPSSALLPNSCLPACPACPCPCLYLPRLPLPLPLPAPACSAATDRILMHFSDELVPVIETPQGLYETARVVSSVSESGLDWAGLGWPNRSAWACAAGQICPAASSRHENPWPPCDCAHVCLFSRLQVNPGILPESASKIQHAKDLFAQYVDANVVASQLAMPKQVGGAVWPWTGCTGGQSGGARLARGG